MSTLHVENLKGLSSGGNANKIIVPSGQTLHAPGHVIQVQMATVAGGTGSSTATSFTDQGISINITPKFATSKILVSVNSQVGINRNSATMRIDYRCIENASSTELFRYDYYGFSGMNTGGTLSVAIVGSGFFQCSNTNQLTFKTQYQKANGDSGQADTLYPLWYSGSKHNITAMEIAQ